jgi:importin subunit beta-1
MNMAEHIVDDPDASSSPLSPYYEALLSTLMRISDRPDNEHNARTSTYEAISTLITQGCHDDMAIVEKCTLAILERFEALVTSQVCYFKYCLKYLGADYFN